MRNLLTTAALATALAACGGVDDRADQPSVLARVQGVVSNPQNLQVAGDLHLALVWDSRALEPDVTYEDIINHPLFVVSEDLPLTTSFPTNFTLSLTNPPPGEVVDDSVGVPPDESKGEGPGWHGVDARAAAGILVLYNDRNHNGRLDLVDIDDDGKGEFIDDVVGMAKRTEVFWFEAPLPADLHYPDAYGQPSAGFNVVVSSQDIFQADFYVGGWTFLFDLATPFAWQPLDSPVTIELSDDPVLDVVMCRKTMTGCLRRIAKSVKD